MTAPLQREEYFLKDGRLISHVNKRGSKYAKWRKGADYLNLVIAIENWDSHKRFHLGPAQTAASVTKALLRNSRHEADPNAADIGESVPHALRTRVAESIQRVVDKIVDQYMPLANEESQTGVLVADINTQEGFVHQGWEVAIHCQVFSPELKEPKVGADIGVIIDLKHAGVHIAKAVWIQAKRAARIAHDLQSIRGLRQQVNDMRKHTNDAYTVVYTPDEVAVFPQMDAENAMSVSQLFDQVILCVRGDRSPNVIANTLDKEFLIEVAIDGPIERRRSERTDGISRN